ncbi:MAG: hypothetical protein Q4A66_09205, partial [Eubacteriales bacterium]|nr:hypothetical protein [Eubacteriales bacterium]
ANPPKSLVIGNRIMTVVFACIAGLVIFWSQLQDAAGRFGKWVLLMILRFLYFIGQLLSGEESQGGQQQQMDPTAMFAEFGETETSSFWAFLEKVAVVLAIVIGVVLVVLALRVVFRLILRGLRHLREYMARFAQVTGEDYEDEQIDLFDLDDLREQTKERLQKAMRRLTRRTKKWDDMDAREKVRFSVRQLYAKAGYTNGELNPLTIREAAPKLPSTPFGEERLADLYEKARYSQTEPTAQEAEELRKAVKH